jgi:hypothetical protein
MSADQTKLILQLAKKIKSAPKNRNKIVASLKAAGILNNAEEISAHYPNLKRVISASAAK